MAPERLRSAPQPGRGRQLSPLGVAIRRPLPVGVGPPHPTTVDGSFYDADFGGYTPITGTSARTSPARLPTFNQLDLRVERTFVFDVWTLGAYLDVQNIFNAQNPENFVYDYRFRDRAPVRGLPILPVIGLRGRF